MAKNFLSCAGQSELAAFVKDAGEKTFRSKQIRSWLFERLQLSPDAMHNLPLPLRGKLSEKFHCPSSEVEKVQTAPDGTGKILLKLHDGEYVEAVKIPSPERVTYCLSTQVGCPVRCVFCASGAGGFKRNLETGEMIEQFFHLCTLNSFNKPDNIVFMGMGEGLMNFENLEKALDVLCSEEFLALSPRRITVSTCGYVPGIRQLAELRKPYNLALSLHACNDRLRQQLLPGNKYKLDEILKACREYREKSTRMLTFEYTLIAGINDSEEAAGELAKLAWNERAKVNLIPLNECSVSELKRPSRPVIEYFCNVLERAGIQYTCRLEKGNKISAACGQLRGAVDGKP